MSLSFKTTLSWQCSGGLRSYTGPKAHFEFLKDDLKAGAEGRRLASVNGNASKTFSFKPKERSLNFCDLDYWWLLGKCLIFLNVNPPGLTS